MALIRLWPTHSHPSHLSSLFTHNTPSGILLEGKKEKKNSNQNGKQEAFYYLHGKSHLFTFISLQTRRLGDSDKAWQVLIIWGGLGLFCLPQEMT